MANIANIIGKLTSINTSLGEIKNAIVGGSNTDYDNLTNKPQINSVTLSGNKTPGDLGLVASASVGVASGVAELDNTGHVPSSQLPSYVDDVVEGYYDEVTNKFYEENTYTTEIPGETGKIYITLDTNLSYRYTGSGFVVVSPSLALGETSSTAYRGDRGKTAYDKSQANETAISNINTLLGNTSIAGIGDGTVTGAISDINSKFRTLLWSNPSTTLNAETISVPTLSNYNYIEIECTFTGGDPAVVSKYKVVDGTGWILVGGLDPNNAGSVNAILNLGGRIFTINTTANTIAFSNGLMTYAGTAYTDWNSRCVPLAIYGLK